MAIKPLIEMQVCTLLLQVFIAVLTKALQGALSAMSNKSLINLGL